MAVDRLRVVIQQPACTRYRVPVFRELSGRDGINLTLYYGDQEGVPNVEPEGFDGRFESVRVLRLAGVGPLYWHGAQWRSAGGGGDAGRPDVLVLTWNSRYVSLVPSLLRARWRGIGTVLWGHGVSKTERGWSLRLRKWIGELASSVLFYNREQADRFVSLGWDRERVFVASNSLDQAPIRAARDAWLADPERLAGFRASQGLGPGPVLLFIARLEEARRLDVLLNAVSQLAGDHPGLTLIVVGTGPDQGRLEGICGRLGITDRVRFVGAIYEEMELAPWCLSADVFAFPSHMGLSLLHAFGYGLPVVTSGALERHGPEIEALKPGVNGLMFPDGDAAGMASAIGRLLSDEPMRVKMGEAALATVTEEFSIERMVDGMEAAIRSAAAGVGGGRREGSARMGPVS